MELVTWIAAGYLLAIPAGYSLEGQRVQNAMHDGVIPIIETDCIWRKSETEYIQFAWASPRVSHPGRPMRIAREVDSTWAGKPTKLFETSLFEGMDMRVSVAFQRLTQPKADVRLYATGLNLSSFREMIEATTLRDIDGARANRDGCKPAAN